MTRSPRAALFAISLGLAALAATPALADGGYRDGYRHGRHHHGQGYYYAPPPRVYYAPPPVYYYPPPPVYYYQPPPPRYYYPPPGINFGVTIR